MNRSSARLSTDKAMPPARLEKVVKKRESHYVQLGGGRTGGGSAVGSEVTARVRKPGRRSTAWTRRT
ncbi:hypothetical protein [Streptomyces sp. NPDC048521]|uniref:hypothetical protein n=1 Tax=Streptomyces sp. NPDC048521 TaxID=3365566 RepID=UPI00371384E1